MELPAPLPRPDDGTLYRLLVEWSRDVIWIMDLSLRTTYMSPAVERELGYTSEEYIALPFDQRLPPESREMAGRMFGELLAELETGGDPMTMKARSFEMLYRHKDGRLIWGEVSIEVLWDDEGRPRGIHGVTRNADERRRWKNAFAESEKKCRDLVEMLPIGIFECSLDGRLSLTNPVFNAMAGLPPGADPSELDIMRNILLDDQGRVRPAMSKRLAGERSFGDTYTAVRRDGTRFPVELHAGVIEEDGLPVGFRGVAIDASAKKRSEEETLKTSKLEAVSLLAGGIAHDFNNILAAVMGNLSLANLGLGELPMEGLEGPKRLLGEAEQAILRARDLTRRLITVSYGGQPEREPLDIGELVREIGNFNTAGSAVRFELVVEEDLPDIEADRSQVSQIVQNIVINAVQAMPKGGTVQARLSREIGPREANLPAGEWFRLDIDDEGPGVPEAIRGRIFDPYFTTKSRGTGIGLAVCLAVARNHGGDIVVGDAPGGGARFSLFLPANPGKAICDEDECVEAAKPTRGLRILFVDDEEAIRRLAGEMATRAGYRLRSASGVEEALALWESEEVETRSFQLAIVDLTLRGDQGGRELLSRLREKSPSLPVILSTGYEDSLSLWDWKSAGFASSLRKPYGMENFVNSIEAAIKGNTTLSRP